MATKIEEETITSTEIETAGFFPASFDELLTPAELREAERGEEMAYKMTPEMIPHKFDPDGLLALYLAECRAYPKLEADEQLRLIRARAEAKLVLENKGAEPLERAAAQKALKSASDKLINSCLMLVFYIALRFVGKEVELSDLIQAGNIALVETPDKYKESKSKGAKFSSYAYKGIWWVIKKGVAENFSSVTTTEHSDTTLNELDQAQGELYQSLKRDPTDEEIAEATKHDLSTVRGLIQASRGVISLNILVGDEKRSELGDLLSDKELPVEVQARQEIGKKCLHTILEQNLYSRQLYITKQHFGLNEDNRERTLEEIGKEQGSTRENIRQIEARGFKQLRQPQVAAELLNILEDIAS